MQSQSANILMINNCAPDNHNARYALQLCAALLEAGHSLQVFFNQRGVDHAARAAAIEPGCKDLAMAYRQLTQETAVRLLVCRAAWSRRHSTELQQPWTQSGLIELAELARKADRVLSFS